jgi:hypothetical protein
MRRIANSVSLRNYEAAVRSPISFKLCQEIADLLAGSDHVRNQGSEAVCPEIYSASEVYGSLS